MLRTLQRNVYVSSIAIQFRMLREKYAWQIKQIKQKNKKNAHAGHSISNRPYQTLLSQVFTGVKTM